jgi:hypothetical protein
MIGLTSSNALADLTTNVPAPSTSSSDSLFSALFAPPSGLPVGAPTINSSGQVVPSTSSSGASGVGGALSSLASSLFGSKSTQTNSPYQLVNNPSSTTLGISNSTIEWVVVGIGVIAIIGIIASGRKK